MMKETGVVYALRAYSVKRLADNKWSIAPTCGFDDKPAWSKPYATLQAACAAIARKHADEWHTRNERRNAFHRKKEVVR